MIAPFPPAATGSASAANPLTMFNVGAKNSLDLAVLAAAAAAAGAPWGKPTLPREGARSLRLARKAIWARNAMLLMTDADD